MLVYKTLGLCERAEQLFREMELNDIVPDLPAFTTLINSNHKSRNLERCWELHKIVQQRGLVMDQPYIGMMMTVYSSVTPAILSPMTQRKLSSCTRSTSKTPPSSLSLRQSTPT